MASITISHSLEPKPRLPRGLWSDLANSVLGEKYELSIAFVEPSEIKMLNKKYRGKASSTDILSFSLSPLSGEIIFCMQDVAEQAPLFKRSVSNFLNFLFIHGLVHLKGYEHGSRMEREEIKFRKKFKI